MTHDRRWTGFFAFVLPLLAAWSLAGAAPATGQTGLPSAGPASAWTAVSASAASPGRDEAAAASPAADPAAKPTVSMSYVASGSTGAPHDTFTVTIRFSESVSEFIASDITVTNGAVSGTLSGSGATYTAKITPNAGLEGSVTVSIAANKATNATNEGNLAGSVTIPVDNVAPVVLRRSITGSQLLILFDDELHPDHAPVAADFLVRINGRAETPASASLERASVAVTLVAPVTSSDVVTLSYIRGTNPLQDVTGNYVAEFTAQPVVNRTGVASTPSAPTGLTATPSATAITLNWTAPARDGGSRITGYKIEGSPTGTANWTVEVANTGSTATRWTDTGLGNGVTRFYRVSAINAAGTGAASTVASATTLSRPLAPTGLTATAGGVNQPNQITLSWTAAPASQSVTGYRIESSPSALVGWTVLVANTRTATNTYVDSNIPPGTTRYYRIAAINSRGTSPYSSVATATTRAGPPSAPLRPNALASGSTGINITWSPPATNGGATITGYRVEGRTGAGSWILVGQPSGSSTTSYHHTGLQANTTWRYRIAAVNSQGTGPYSVETTATTEASAPGAPTNLAARGTSTSRIDLSWTPPENNGGNRITGYRIQRSSDGASWTTLRSTTGSTSTVFSHTGVAPGTRLYYRVAAINATGVGAWSNVAAASTDPEAPGAPTGLTARASGSSAISLAWTAPARDGGAAISGYSIDVSSDGVSWQTLVSNTLTATTTRVHQGLDPGSTRHYRVHAINSAGKGPASNVASATTDAVVPDAPTGLVAAASAPDRIDLSWTAPAYDGGSPVTGYRIEVSETGAGWAVLAQSTASTATNYAHQGLAPGSTRFYRVSAINVAGAGSPSAVASAATDDPVGRAGRLNTELLPHAVAAMATSTVSAISDRVSAFADGRPMDRQASAGGVSGLAAGWMSAGRGAAGAASAMAGGMEMPQLLNGTSFSMAAPQAASGGVSLATWGAFEHGGLSETGASAVDWSGSMTTFHLGADARFASDMLAGVAATRSSGDFDFTDSFGETAVDGVYGMAMTSVSPYFAWLPGGRGNAVWATGGMGWGDVEVEDASQALRSARATLRSGAAGVAYRIFGAGAGGVRIKGDAWAGRVVVDGTAEIDSITLDMQRGRLMLEWTQGFQAASGDEIGLRVEGGVRGDAGDAAAGVGMEMGGGLRFASPRTGVSVSVRGRVLVTGSEGYEEWGAGGVVVVDPGARGRGLSVRVAPSWGRDASGLAGLWEQGAAARAGVGPAGAGPAVAGEVVWGRGLGAAAPYTALRVAPGRGRYVGSGVRYDLGEGFGVRLEAARRQGVVGGAEHTLGLRGSLQLR